MKTELALATLCTAALAASHVAATPLAVAQAKPEVWPSPRARFDVPIVHVCPRMRRVKIVCLDAGTTDCP